MIDKDIRDKDIRDIDLLTVRNVSEPEIKQVLSVLLLADSDYHNQLIDRLDPRVAEKEHFVVTIGYFDAYKGSSQ